MTITTEPTTTPEVPAWLNLDGYCPPDLRARITDVRERLASLMPELTDLGKELARVSLDVDVYQEPMRIALDDHTSVTDPWVGIESLRNEVVTACDQLLASEQETIKGNPEWYLDMVAERLEHLSTWAPAQLRAAGRDVPENPAEINRAQTMDPGLLARLNEVQS